MFLLTLKEIFFLIRHYFNDCLHTHFYADDQCSSKHLNSVESYRYLEGTLDHKMK